MAVTLIDYLYLPKIISKVNSGILIERAHYHTILVERAHTIWDGILIKEDALTEVVRYAR